MNPDIKLNKRMFGASARVAPNWITNGHWAVKRSRVANQALYGSAELASLHVYKNTHTYSIKDEIVDKVVPDCKDFRRFTRTDWVHVNSMNQESRLFMDKDNQPAFFNREYVDTFGLEEVYGKDPNKPFTDRPERKYVTIVIMGIDSKDVKYPNPKA